MIRARKRFGQHFLASPHHVAAIVRRAGVGPGSKVLEVGPGLGVLTEALLAAGADVTAVELDRDLAAFLRERLPAVHLVEADAVKVVWADLLEGGGWTCVSNLPYNVGTGLVTDMVQLPGVFSRLVVMLQKEVADRMVADVGDRNRGSLSVHMQAYADVDIALSIPPGAFHPPPKVDSAVIDVRLLEAPRFGAVDPQHFSRVLRAGFSQPRKMMRKTLGDLWGKDEALHALAQAGIPETIRPAELELSAWVALAESAAALVPSPFAG
jgi:16S rRNA (adenine1518-N6/adenine1519-N6)-dimethyltransferase